MTQRFLAWWRSLDSNVRNYWLGILLLFLGLAWGISVATALTVSGAVIAGESAITSYLAQWLKRRVE